VAFRLHVVPDLLYFPIRANQHAASDDSLVGPPHEFLHSPETEGFYHLVFGIAQKTEIQFVFFFEAGERLHHIGAYAKDLNILFFKGLLCVAKLGRFNGSTGSIGFWIEKEKGTFASQVSQRHFSSRIRLQTEIRSCVSSFQHFSLQDPESGK